MKTKSLTGIQIPVLIVLSMIAAGFNTVEKAQEKGPDNTSKVPKFTFGKTLEEQEAQLKENLLINRFKESRHKLSTDPYRPLYHYVNPEGNLNDPNGLCFWNNRWHLFYQAYPPEDPRQHWGHAVSNDLVHWRDLPYAIYPNPEQRCYSGATYVEKDKVIAMYLGTTKGIMIATSDDPLLLNWEKLAENPVIPIAAPGETLPYWVGDACIWKKGNMYYALSGGTLPNGPAGKNIRANFLFKSKDLKKWKYLHPFVEDDRFTSINDDGSCPYFWPIGDKHILLFFSHVSGGQYLLGDYDKKRDKFVVTTHGRFNHGPSNPFLGGVHAPSAYPDSKGGIIAILNMNVGKPTNGWNQVMTLPMRLTLNNKEDLMIEPVKDITSLRYDHKSIKNIALPGNTDFIPKNIGGNSIEIRAEIDLENRSVFEMRVLCSPDQKEYTRILFYKDIGYWRRYRRDSESLITLDTSHSSTLPAVKTRGPETTAVHLNKDENLKLRIFIDKSIVEVFVNSEKFLASRVYPGLKESTGISFRALGKDATLKSLDVWQMKSIWE